MRRFSSLILLFVIELTVLSLWLDGDSLLRNTEVAVLMHDWGAWILRFAVAFFVFFFGFLYCKDKGALDPLADRSLAKAINGCFLLAHGLAICIFMGLSLLLYHRLVATRVDVVAFAWLASGLAAIVLAALSFFPWKTWANVIEQSGSVWLYAAVASFFSCFAGNFARWFWRPADVLSRLTFFLTAAILHPFSSSVVMDPTTMTLGTLRFHEQIAPECSGLEGAGLILAFSVLWLILFRKECRFPQSLILIPLGVSVMFTLNVVRIATLILIGNAGAPEIAEHGFHSQAGWIAFSMVAVMFSFTVLHIPWFAANPQSPALSPSRAANPTAIFLLPFLAILGAGMVDKAFTGVFDWLYPLRFFAAFLLLWFFRKSYAQLDWKFDWVALSIGLIVFVVWVVADRFANPVHENGFPGALQSSSAASVIWITFRILAAVVTVPLAEELAFRGFLMRRLISRDFESVSFRHFSWFALIASSIAFGFLHAGYRFAGIVAGLLFGVIVIRRGRFGEAVVAHATANALLAFYVLHYNQWHLW